MNDPGEYGFDEEQEFFYTPQGEEMYHTDVVEALNALLAVAAVDMKDAFDEWLDLAQKEKAEFFNAWLEHTHPDLAALPEHLKGGEHEAE